MTRLLNQLDKRFVAYIKLIGKNFSGSILFTFCCLFFSTVAVGQQTSTRYEAETATLSGGASVATNHQGYSGSGFVEGYWNVGATVSFSVDVPEAGSKVITLAYSNGNSSINTVSIYVNGKKVKQASLRSSGSWEMWSTASEVLELKTGTNSIAYKYDPDDSGNVNLDYIETGTSSNDTTAPTIPGGITASAISHTSFFLSWNASSDDGGVFMYEVFKDGVSIGTTPNTSMAIRDLDCGTAYTISVRAADSVANWSEQSAPLNVATSKCGMYPVDLGMNWFYNADWDFGFIFADVVKQGRYFATITDWNTPCSIDANGWPTTDFKVILIASGLSGAQGTYKLLFEANTPNVSILVPGDLTKPAGCITIQNQQYNNGLVTADVVVDSSAFGGEGFLSLEFQNTSGGVRNLKCMLPGQEPDDVFANLMLNSIDLFSTIRPMQMVGEPNSPVSTWSERRLPSNPSQANTSAGIGVAYEYLIMWANEAQKDLWLCLPRLADDDYVTKIAQMIKYGSDGVNPYTSPQANPVFPPLDTTVNLYVEYSNEIWNYSHDLQVEIAKDIVSKGDSIHLNWNKSDNIHYWAWEYTAYNIVRISNIFRSVFGDAEMPLTGSSRIRPVLAGQIDRYAVDVVGLEYIDNVWGENNAFGNPKHPVNYYLYALSGAPYPGFNDTQDGLTVDELFEELFDRMSGTGGGTGWTTFDQIDDLKARADQYGLHMNAYEGGQSLIGFGHSVEAKAACQDDPRMKKFTKDLLTKWFSVTDGVFCYFTIGRASDWFAIGNGYLDNNTQKWQALYELSDSSFVPTDTTDVSAIEDLPLQEKGKVFMFPNPANERLNVRVNSEQNTQVIIKIKDLSGKEHLAVEKALLNGSNELELELSELNSGVYLIQVITNGKSFVQKLIVN